MKPTYDELYKSYKELQEAYDSLMELFMPRWAEKLVKSNAADRSEASSIVMEGLLKFKQGKLSPEGKELVSLLENKCEPIGIALNASYMRLKGDMLHNIFIHPFGQRTLLFKLKNFPVLLLTNSSLGLNDSALRKIDGNEIYNRMFNGITGITG